MILFEYVLYKRDLMSAETMNFANHVGKKKNLKLLVGFLKYS